MTADFNGNSAKTVVITGGTSGIGLATARIFKEKNWKVYCIGRDALKAKLLPPGVEFIAADVAKYDRIEEALKSIYEKAGSIDVLISNAGFGISGPIEFTEIDGARSIVETNFMGGFYCAKAVLPYMREKKSGRIVFTSSLAAIMPIPFQSFYSATKAAVNLMAGALDNEVKAFGIRASVVMPGDVRTGFTGAREKSSAGAEIYGEMAKKAVEVMEHDEETGMNPDEIAKSIYKAATAAHRPWHVPGMKYKFFAFLYRVFPIKLIYKIIGMTYIGK